MLHCNLSEVYDTSRETRHTIIIHARPPITHVVLSQQRYDVLLLTLIISFTLFLLLNLCSILEQLINFIFAIVRFSCHRQGAERRMQT